MATSFIFETSPSPFQTFGTKLKVPSEDMVCIDSPDVFKDITVLKTINKAKFPVYLVSSRVNKKSYAMKVFGYSGSKPHTYFQNESRFSFVSHPNIIRTHHVEHERESISKGSLKKISYTIMEYAPYGDFFDLIMNASQDIDETLIRTYFRQMIEGVEYLHKNGVSHMDLKLENLLLGQDFSLKIADFDLSYLEGDNKIISRGTKFYRPPEVIQGRCGNTQAADIYSAGIILFTFKTKGMLPHAEDACVAGIDFAGLLYTQNNEFWNKHAEIQKKDSSFFDDDFKNLFNAMIRLDPNERATISQIKQSNWYNGPVYTPEEVKAKVARLFIGF